MSGECDTCGEHCLDCKCTGFIPRQWVDKKDLIDVLPLYLPYYPPRRVSAIRLAHDAKVLENAQRLKNMEDREAMYGKEVYLNGPIICKSCEKEPIDCECVHG